MPKHDYHFLLDTMTTWQEHIRSYILLENRSWKKLMQHRQEEKSHAAYYMLQPLPGKLVKFHLYDSNSQNALIDNVKNLGFLLMSHIQICRFESFLD